MIELPIDVVLGEIVGRVRDGSGVVVVAAPGAGKSTRVAPALLEVVQGAIVMLQPRRVAARAVAEWIAEERGWRVGNEVGYHIRFEKRYGAGTRLRVLTEAILTRMLLSDPYLEGVGCVILDEFHERNLHTDLAIAFLRELQQTVRPDLKIVVMSATLDAGPVAKFLGDAAVVVSEGRTFPVEVEYRAERDLEMEERVARAVEEVARSQEPEARRNVETEGDVLVFLPGMGMIERARRRLEQWLPSSAVILPLHGSLDSAEQQQALRPDPQGRRKIILATNIAETSLTIDGVRAVVDSGVARIASFDAERGITVLRELPISQASAEQRAGRAGRQGPGRAIRLWAEREQKHRVAFNEPEIQRVDLAEALLAVHAWGGDPRKFGWFEKPAEEMLETAEALLGLLGALHEGQLTEVGKAMMRVPAHPRIARVLIAAAGTALESEAVRVAAVLSDDSPSARMEDALWPEKRLPERLMRVREQMASVVRGLPKSKERVESVTDLLVLAYPDRVARHRENDRHRVVLVNGFGARLANEAASPAVMRSELLLALDVRDDPRRRGEEVAVRSAVAIEEEVLARFFPEGVRTSTELEFDEASGKVRAVTRRRFHSLVLEEKPHGQVDVERAGAVLAKALAPKAREIFLKEEGAAKILARVALVRKFAPEMGWPELGDEALRGLLAEACAGRRSVEEVRGRLAEVLRGALVYPLDRELEKLAPETLEVPSGSRIRLDYAMPTETGEVAAPILAVRLQELFGWTQTPRVCGGRVAVVLHLLSPGFKPMQITTDLASFWRSAYFEVRKDLRVRYPKHKWPEDPLTATAEAKGRPRR